MKKSPSARIGSGFEKDVRRDATRSSGSRPGQTFSQPVPTKIPTTSEPREKRRGPNKGPHECVRPESRIFEEGVGVLQRDDDAC